MKINPVIIFGAKGSGLVALDIFESNGVVVYGFLEEDEAWHGKEIGSVTVLGGPDDHGFLKLIGQKCDAFVALDSQYERQSQAKTIMDLRKVMPVNAVHRDASISVLAQIGHGNLVHAQAVVAAEARLSNHIVLGSGAVVENGASLSDYCQIGAKAVIGAGAIIKQGATIGQGALIMPRITIGKGASVGPGSLVIANVPDETTVFGSPAKAV